MIYIKDFFKLERLVMCIIAGLLIFRNMTGIWMYLFLMLILINMIAIFLSPINLVYLCEIGFFNTLYLVEGIKNISYGIIDKRICVTSIIIFCLLTASTLFIMWFEKNGRKYYNYQSKYDRKQRGKTHFKKTHSTEKKTEKKKTEQKREIPRESEMMSDMNFFCGCKNAEEIKSRWKSLCKLYHPDNIGSDNIMKLINQQYNKTMKMI